MTDSFLPDGRQACAQQAPDVVEFVVAVTKGWRGVVPHVRVAGEARRQCGGAEHDELVPELTALVVLDGDDLPERAFVLVRVLIQRRQPRGGVRLLRMGMLKLVAPSLLLLLDPVLGTLRASACRVLFRKGAGVVDVACAQDVANGVCVRAARVRVCACAR